MWAAGIDPPLGPLMTKWTQELRPTLALALPIVLGQLSQVLMAVIDSMMVGHVGTVELAGAAFVGAVFSVAFIACLGLLQAGAVLVAREHGAGRDDLCGMWLRHARGLAWVAGGGTAALMASCLFIDHHFGQPTEVVAVMRPYFLLMAFALVPSLLFQADRQFVEALGRPWAPLAIMLASVGLNVGLNWVFIYGKLGAPVLGLTGAGVATLISRTVAVLVLRGWLGGHASFAVAAVAAARGARIERGRAREMLALGLPMGAALFFEGGAFSAAAVMAGWLGTVSLAAHQIVISCATAAFMVPLGLSIALAMRVGRAVGGGRREAVRPIVVGAIYLTVGSALISTLVFGLAGEAVAGAFVKEDAAVVSLAARVLLVVAVFQLFDGLQVVFAGALRGLTDVRVPLAAAFTAYWVLALPGAYLFGVRGGGGLVIVWVALATGLAAAALGLGCRLIRMTGPRGGLF